MFKGSEDDRSLINGMLQCIGYDLRDHGYVLAKNREIPSSLLWIRDIPKILKNDQENNIFEFIDEYTGYDANLNGRAWYEGTVLNLLVINNFVRMSDPWYRSLPILQVAYDSSNNTASFLYRRHALIGKIENKKLKANRIPAICNCCSDEISTFEQLIKELDNCFDLELTPDVLEKEIETGEVFGPPDLIRFFKKIEIL